MAATYSSFMTTRFYNPVFNTALFDGPLRIYFSQSYESSALKLYHLIQTEHENLWKEVKEWSLKNKEHIYLLIYPDLESAKFIFGEDDLSALDEEIFMQEWEEGLAFGLIQPGVDQDLSQQLTSIEKNLSAWLRDQNLLNSENVLRQV